MDDNTPFGRFGLLGKPKAAKSSWWLNLERQDFSQAVEREAVRMNQKPQPVIGQNRVVGTNHGKI